MFKSDNFMSYYIILYYIILLCTCEKINSLTNINKLNKNVIHVVMTNKLVFVSIVQTRIRRWRFVCTYLSRRYLPSNTHLHSCFVPV